MLHPTLSDELRERLRPALEDQLHEVLQLLCPLDGGAGGDCACEFLWHEQTGSGGRTGTLGALGRMRHSGCRRAAGRTQTQNFHTWDLRVAGRACRCSTSTQTLSCIDQTVMRNGVPLYYLSSLCGPRRVGSFGASAKGGGNYSGQLKPPLGVRGGRQGTPQARRNACACR
eukprot:scaffold18199_cov69-Phaeocystis_antarctica.AAC.5